MKEPIFTTNIFSTKSFGPGHVIGAAILVVGTVVVARHFVARGQDEARKAALQSRSGNQRGQYGGIP